MTDPIRASSSRGCVATLAIMPAGKRVDRKDSSSNFKVVLRVCGEGDVAALRAALASDPDLAADPRLLCEAALHGRIEVVRRLLSAGADPDGQVASHENYRPLHRAIEHRGVAKNSGHDLVVAALLEAGASLDARATWMSLTPLAVAGMSGNVAAIQAILDRSPRIDLFTAAILADAARVEGFLSHSGAATSRDSNQMTALHYVALSGLDAEDAARDQRRIVEILLAAGADGDAREPIGPYPPTPVLHFAAWKNFVVARALLESGANPDGGFGNCLWREPGAMAELFFSHGANVNAREPSGQPLLNSRIHWNLRTVAEWLLERGADPNLTDEAGNTALHEAASRGVHPQLVQCLLDHGAKVDVRNVAGKTALDIALAKKRDRLLPLLSPA